jgi:Tfp pilus assembly protein PilF
MEAMVAAENGNISAALSWIEKAKAIVGETAEVVCRESVVYSFCDTKKSNELLEKCLAIDPKHPRAHYLQGIRLAKEGNLQGAIQAYETAIAHYPKTDVFHLNEVYNNLGGIFYKMKNYDQARTAWEKALLYLPSDRMAQDNLRDFIYKRDKTIIS